MPTRQAILLTIVFSVLTGLVTHRLTIRSNGTLNERHENLTICAESIAETLGEKGAAFTKAYFDAKAAEHLPFGTPLSAKDKAVINMTSTMGASASVLMTCATEGGGTLIRSIDTQQLQ